MNTAQRFSFGGSRCARVVSLVLLSAVLALPLSAVSAQSSIFPVDVWTDRGGEGYGVAGGTYRVGEITTIWLHVGLDCQVSWTITGPEGSSMESGYLPAGTYSLELGVAEASDVGMWSFEVQAISGSIVAMDTVQFQVVAAATTPPSTTTPAPPATTTPAPPATTTPAPTAPASQGSALALDALVALKMAQGSMAPDLRYDADGNGQVTVEDARLLLRWAVQ